MDAEKRESVFDKSSRTEGSSEGARPSRHAVLQLLYTTVHYKVNSSEVVHFSSHKVKKFCKEQQAKRELLIIKVSLCYWQSTFKENTFVEI